ncbi:MAG: FAD-dependent monooxygenase [Azospirillaceae bacterium]|nr:FAD-dependent monooxygenase [Azospirillaceae bacterium]
MDHDVEVLVIGAGPTGLALAAMLGRLGVHVRIVDKADGRSTKSKALGVHAGTLEALGDVFGTTLPGHMLALGQPVRRAFFHLGGGRPLSLDLTAIPNPYSFILILPQSETERLLEETAAAAGVGVERNVEALDLQQDESGVQCRLRHPDGTVEMVRAAYVVGCDGAHSLVRHQVGAAFDGGAYSGIFLLADLTLDWDLGFDAMHLFSTAAGAMAFFPLPGQSGKCRLVVMPRAPTVDPGAADPGPDIDLPAFTALAESASGRRLALRDPVWLTRFTIHHRMVGALRHGRVFLAGDAAHIHSPAGGQGMNTGIQDALNLAARLVAVLRQGQDASILDRYGQDRLPVARRVLRGTDLIFRAALLSGGWRGWLVRHLMPAIVAVPFLRRRVALALSQVDVARAERPVRLAALASAGQTGKGSGA